MTRRPKDYHGLAFTSSLHKDSRQKQWEKQRTTRGFDDTELWSLDRTIASFVLPRLRLFLKRGNGRPMNLSSKEWDGKLRDMVKAFEMITDEDVYYGRNVEQERIIQKGLRAFANWFPHLWE